MLHYYTLLVHAQCYSLCWPYPEGPWSVGDVLCRLQCSYKPACVGWPPLLGLPWTGYCDDGSPGCQPASPGTPGTSLSVDRKTEREVWMEMTEIIKLVDHTQVNGISCWPPKITNGKKSGVLNKTFTEVKEEVKVGDEHEQSQGSLQPNLNMCPRACRLTKLCALQEVYVPHLCCISQQQNLKSVMLKYHSI